MKKYAKILSCHIGTERPTTEYCEQLEADLETQRTNVKFHKRRRDEAEEKQKALIATNVRLRKIVDEFISGAD
jgi:hypothetical protein